MKTVTLSVVTIIVICVSLSACGSLQVELNATATQVAPNISVSQTAPTLAATGTMAASPSPTVQPSPTASPALTPSQASATQTPPTATPAANVKLDFEQSLVWTKPFGSDLTDEMGDIAADRLGNIYVVCVCGVITDSSGGYVGQALLKYSGAGDLLWERPQGAGSGGHFDQAVATDSAANVIMMGNFQSENDQTSYVVEYDSAGNKIWKNKLTAHLSDVAADEAGNVYVAGRIGPKAIAFIRKYSCAGKELWTQQLSGDVNGLTLKLAVGTNGNVNLVGSLSGTLPGQSSYGGEDVFCPAVCPHGRCGTHPAVRHHSE